MLTIRATSTAAAPKATGSQGDGLRGRGCNAGKPRLQRRRIVPQTRRLSAASTAMRMTLSMIVPEVDSAASLSLGSSAGQRDGAMRRSRVCFHRRGRSATLRARLRDCIRGTLSVADILQEIVAHKRGEVARARAEMPAAKLQEHLRSARPVRDFAAALKDRHPLGLIAEVKKASPSAGLIRADFDPI